MSNSSRQEWTRSVYKERTVAIRGEKHEAEVTINGRSIEVYWDESTNRYQTRQLPHTSYETLQDLAEAVVNYVPSFRRMRR